jgi:hypothetical protein
LIVGYLKKKSRAAWLRTAVKNCRGSGRCQLRKEEDNAISDYKSSGKKGEDI